MKHFRRIRTGLFALACLAGLSGCIAPQSDPSSSPAVTTTLSPTTTPPSGDPYAELWGKIDGSTATIPLAEGIAMDRLSLGAEDAAARVKFNRTHEAIVNLIEKRADLIFVTHPSAEELALAADKGIELEIVPVVKDALIFLVNAKNPIDSLTQRQLIDIYTDAVTNWKTLGGSDSAIKAFQRPDNSGSQTLFTQLLMKGATPAPALSELRPEGMGGLVEEVADYDNAQSAIGFSLYYYVTDMYIKDEVKLLGVDGVIPSKESIRSGAYPLPTYYYAVLRKDTAPEHPARSLLAWLLTAEGQAVAEAAGYVPMQ